MPKDVLMEEILQVLDGYEQREQSTEQPLLQQDAELGTFDGFIEVKDGEIYVQNAGPRGKQPSLQPHESYTLYVNGKPIQDKTIVFKEDRIHWELPAVEAYSIQVDEGKLTVSLQFNPAAFRSFRLKETAPANSVKVELVETEATLDRHTVCSEVVEKLIGMGIEADINVRMMMEELKRLSGKPIVVAKGIAPVQPVDAHLELLFENEVKEVLHEVDGKVDFKKRLEIPNVIAGDVIAILHPPKAGKEGLNIFGEPIHVPAPKQLKLREGKNVKITDGKVIALIDGRPTLTGRAVKQITVLPIYEVHGNVDIKTGNIYFHGDVEINGNVMEGMRVEAAGNVRIKGNVYQATVTASQNISISGTVMRSHIYAGRHGLFYSMIYTTMQELHIEIETFFTGDEASVCGI
ncbi:FapA family protein [Bacillus tianshenii]|nr:FapA family protein [Bacillus tianshenii]